MQELKKIWTFLPPDVEIVRETKRSEYLHPHRIKMENKFRVIDILKRIKQQAQFGHYYNTIAHQ